MAPEHGGALARLCRAHMWSYGVVWRADRLDSRLLRVEDSFCEEEVKGEVANVFSQVHMVGKGIIGETALSGSYKWIYIDNSVTYLGSPLHAHNPESPLGKAGWINQCSAGIKTIAIISLSSFGVAQFGSTKKVPESLEFIGQTKHQLNAYEDANFSDHHVTFDSTNSGEAYTYHQTRNSSDGSNSTSMPGRELIRAINHSSNTISRALSDYRFMNNNASAYELPAASCSPATITEFFNRYQITSSESKKSVFGYSKCQTNVASAEPHAAVSPIIRSLATLDCPDSSDTAIFSINKNVDASVMGQAMLSSSGLEESSNSLPINSHFPVPCMNSSDHVSIHPPSIERGLHDAILGIRSSKVGKGSSGEIMLPLPFASPANIGAAYDTPSHCSDLPYAFGSSTQVLPPENSVQVLLEGGQGLNPLHLSDEKPKKVNDFDVETNENLAAISVSSGLDQSVVNCHNMASEEPKIHAQNNNVVVASSVGLGSSRKHTSSKTPDQLLRDNDLFNGMELDPCPFNFVHEYWDDIVIPNSCSNLGICLPECVSESQMDSFAAVDKGLFSGSDLEQFVDAIVGDNINNNSSQGASGKGNLLAGLSLDNQLFSISSLNDPPVCTNQISSIRIPPICHTSNVLLSHCNPGVIHGSSGKVQVKASITSMIDDNHRMNTDNSLHNQLKQNQEIKVVKKRARPGESTRPRPKDRQQIQDRVRELREIVPNGAKCSIDALLDRTIKHMLFLQSVTKYADKLKQADEPKIVEESGVVLKDNSGSCSSGGATWAYEVAGQTMVCPIIVEDLSPPGQMLVEMLCDERGFFLEIADMIRGFGLTILKGVMEVRGHKIWARFLVEANKDVTRMDIFLSLVQLLQQTSSTRSNEQATRLIDKGTSIFPNYQQSLMPIP